MQNIVKWLSKYNAIYQSTADFDKFFIDTVKHCSWSYDWWN